MLRAAIIGPGWWGKTLVTAVQGKSDAITFVAAATRTPAKVEEFCRQHGLKLLADYEAALADPDIDAVVLATPHSQHGDQVRRAAAAGKHVFCEKPFTLTADDARRAVDAATKAGIVLAVGFNRRFHPSLQEMKRRVRDGAFGAAETCIGEQTAGAGATIVLVKFAEGIAGTFFCSLTTVPNYRFAVYGSKAFAEILKPNLDEFRFAPVPDPKLGHLASMQPEVKQTSGFDTLFAELTTFAACIRDKKIYPVPLDEVVHGVEVFEAIAQSSKDGKPVKVG